MLSTPRVQVLSGTQMAQHKTDDGAIEALRLIKIARDSAVKARTTALITLKASLVTASEALRAELELLRDFKARHRLLVARGG